MSAVLMILSVPVPTILSGERFVHAPRDLELVSSHGTSLDVHRVVVFCSSPFLDRLIQFDSKKGGAVIRQIGLPHTSHATLNTVVQFAYNGSDDFSGLNLVKLLEEVDYLNVKGLCDLVSGRLMAVNSEPQEA